jgi:hypothetical protein
LLLENPQRFPIIHREIRCVRARRFPYSVFFRAEALRIAVLAVSPARRDPGAPDLDGKGRWADNAFLEMRQAA